MIEGDIEDEYPGLQERIDKVLKGKIRVYIVSTYGEYGAENVHATTDPDKVPTLLGMVLDDLWAPARPGTVIAPPDLRFELARIAEVLASGEPGEFNLSEGWGGFQLHIVELE